ncbi:hypothetical protein KCP78_08180 [Salmonella enterica subsp. enterica]|nr:hypothetical protein KCP78_08180 [Salmonella enterica subsp. enterica]
MSIYHKQVVSLISYHDADVRLISLAHRQRAPTRTPFRLTSARNSI